MAAVNLLWTSVFVATLISSKGESIGNASSALNNEAIA